MDEPKEMMCEESLSMTIPLNKHKVISTSKQIYKMIIRK